MTDDAPDDDKKLSDIFAAGAVSTEPGAPIFSNTVIILTSNVASDQLTPEGYKEAMKHQMEQKIPPAMLERFKPITIAPFTEMDMTTIAGSVMARELETPGMTKEEKTALGDIAMELAKQEGYDPKEGARGMVKALDRAMDKPMKPEVEDALCEKSQVFAKRVNGRRADALAEGFKTGVDAKPMKRLRLNKGGAS